MTDNKILCTRQKPIKRTIYLWKNVDIVNMKIDTNTLSSNILKHKHDLQKNIENISRKLLFSFLVWFELVMLPLGHDMSLRLKSPPIQTVALLLPVQSPDSSLMELFTYSDTFKDCLLEQIVNFPTRKNKTLDLFITNKPSLVSKCKSLPGLFCPVLFRIRSPGFVICFLFASW
jgi:hypothetical protein